VFGFDGIPTLARPSNSRAANATGVVVENHQGGCPQPFQLLLCSCNCLITMNATSGLKIVSTSTQQGKKHPIPIVDRILTMPSAPRSKTAAAVDGDWMFYIE
jgi:hypothetical protein